MTDNVVKALWAGLGWAAAIALAHLGHGIGLILALGQPPLTWFAMKGSLIELLMGVTAGLLLAPLMWVPKWGRVVHGAALCGLWLVIERIVAVDPSKPLMWIGPPVAAAGLLALGTWIAKRSVAAAVGLPAVTFVALLAAPEIRSALTAEKEAPVELVAAAPGAPDVLFIVMDTTRSQSLSTHGYARDTSPNLERLAAEGVLYEGATAASTWSLPSHAALFTGTFPSYNQAHDETRFLGPELTTIAELFAQNGYETRCFSANPHISDAFGLTRGFHYSDRAWAAGPAARQFSFVYRWVDFLGLGANDKGGAQVVGNIREWLNERPKDGPPNFVFVNFLEAHFPFHQLPKEYVYAYQDRPMSELRDAGQIAFGAQFGRPLTDAEIAQIRQPLVDLYDGGVKYTDFLVGQVVEEWRARGLLDNTIVVVLGDHGEVVGEHDAFGHVTAVVEEDLRVPLVFRYPKKLPQGKRITKPVSTTGTLATLAELADVPLSPEGDGLKQVRPQVGSLLAFDDPKLGEPIIAERFEEHLLSARFAPGTANGKGPLVNPRGRYRTFRFKDWKYVQHWEAGKWSEHLYNLATDPGEQHDVFAENAAGVVDLDIKPDLNNWITARSLPPLDAEVTGTVKKVEDMSAEERQQLCELGYLSGSDCE